MIKKLNLLYDADAELFEKSQNNHIVVGLANFVNDLIQANRSD